MIDGREKAVSKKKKKHLFKLRKGNLTSQGFGLPGLIPFFKRHLGVGLLKRSLNSSMLVAYTLPSLFFMSS